MMKLPAYALLIAVAALILIISSSIVVSNPFFRIAVGIIAGTYAFNYAKKTIAKRNIILAALIATSASLAIYFTSGALFIAIAAILSIAIIFAFFSGGTGRFSWLK